MDPTEFMELIKTRRSVRAYSDKNISSSIVNELVEAARWAPTAGNLQPVEIVIVTDGETKYELSQAAGGQEFLDECSVVFVMCVDTPRTSSVYKERGEHLYTLQDVAAATQNVMLSAWSHGIGSCWVGAFKEQEVSAICRLPDHVRPTIMIALGYPDPEVKISARQRREQEDFTHQNTW